MGIINNEGDSNVPLQIETGGIDIESSAMTVIRR